jgi:N-methylhydantoinase A
MARLGVDIGGTFTDVVLERAGQIFSAKVLTTHQAPEEAIVEGMVKVCATAGIAPSAIEQIIHGTTLATNALIERRGAKTALITTEGFRDVIEMRTESRFEQYDLNLTLPAPLLPRNRRYIVRERMDARGQVLIALDEGEVRAIGQDLRTAGYDSIAIGLLHSYANPSHERQIRDILTGILPGVTFSLSSEVSPQMREYERFNTTIANAYIKPLMKGYLDRLGRVLAGAGAESPIFLMHSGGGIISLESAAEFPVRLVESGPAGGAVFAAELAARHGLRKVLSFDMGGTTAKICLIRDHTPKTARVFEVARSYRFKKGSGMPISIPVIDMVEIGAGGGSLARVDGMGQIRVGPESAGSEPGPACYGRGGDRPAVTDADLVLGKLDAASFAGGTMPLDYGRAVYALTDEIGDALDMHHAEAAWGLSEVVDETMANAARVHAVENGEDLAEYTMIAFGGAAPLHAARLCEKLGIGRCLVPSGAGVGSAIGFLHAPFGFEATRSHFMRLTDFDPATVRAIFQALEQEATGFVRTCDATAKIEAAFKVYMRYSGQGWEIPVEISAAEAQAATPAIFLAAFEAAYSTLFARTVAGMDVEITLWSVNAHTPQQMPEPARPVTPQPAPPATGERALFDCAGGDFQTAAIHPRKSLAEGATLSGPALITEDETTIIVPASRSAMVLSDGSIAVFAKGN